jgi:hypothetical protein
MRGIRKKVEETFLKYAKAEELDAIAPNPGFSLNWT